MGRRLSRLSSSLAVGLRSFVVARPALVLGALVFALALAVRLPDLGASTNVDAILYWFGRTRKFWAALAEGRYSEMYYSPHPGVSIMWLAGASLRAAGLLGSAVTERSLVVATTPLAVVASAMPAATVPLVFRALTAQGRSAATGAGARFGAALEPGQALAVAALTGALLATEPFLVAHARTFQLDSMATSFVWLATLLAVLTVIERRVGFAVGAGACFGIAVLTRMLSGTFLLGLGVAFLLVFVLERPRSARVPLLLVLMGGTALATAVLLWPALLVSPVETVSRILKSTDQTVGKGHIEFSWGEVHARDPGPGFYGGVVLMRLSPEVLVLSLVALALAWRWPKRTLLVAAIVACAYLPPAVGLLASAKKADRYALLFFPFITLVGASGLVSELARIPLVAKRAALVVAVTGVLLLGGRALRLAAVHPVPIAWCASYPGLRCENVITLGQGEGFRDAALWIADNTPVQNPSILSAYAGGAVLGPWLQFRRSRDGKNAHFIVTYIASDQRGRDTKTREYAVGEPVHEVRYQDRTYVRVFLGPKHPDRDRGKRRRRRED